MTFTLMTRRRLEHVATAILGRLGELNYDLSREAKVSHSALYRT